jgi:hypothetical protein
MITKTQWDEICSYVYSAKIMGLHPLFKGRRVSEVDLNKKEIVTIKRGGQLSDINIQIHLIIMELLIIYKKWFHLRIYH